jgi:hypothetical protein
MSGISPHQKKDPKKRQQGLKGKRGETSYKEAPCLKKEDEIYMHCLLFLDFSLS